MNNMRAEEYYNRFKALVVDTNVKVWWSRQKVDVVAMGKPVTVENVKMVDRYNTKKSLNGTLYLTTTHLIFVDPENKKETWILLMHIGAIEKQPLSTSGSPLLIRCKIFRSVTFIIPRERDCHAIYHTILNLSQPSTLEELYCFHFTSACDEVPKNVGWNFFDTQAEFQRMGVPNEHWVLSGLNSNYNICDTYPHSIYVPVMASTPVIVGSSKFRSKGRLPVLTYFHPNKAALSRCSQPLSGFSARCLEDEQLLNCILKANPNFNYMYVVDTRPRINAMANRAAGKGYENENFYENIRFHFHGIENIHVMRNSLAKLMETCEVKNNQVNSFLNGIESSGWLRHIKAILDTSYFIARAVNEGVSVLVHCSDGWDRTAQTCSLAQLILDPYYRTIQGFQAMIEKEWLAFGHKFIDRCGYISGDSKEMSPIFTQFLDATWQLLSLCPTAFQFNEVFLLTLHDHVYSCQYGTFIGNCEKDRLDLKLSERTYSLWGFMATKTNEYYNPFFCETQLSFLKCQIVPQSIRFWRGMYCRFEGGLHPRECLFETVSSLYEHSLCLQDHIKYLEKKIENLIEFSHNAHKNKSIDNKDADVINGIQARLSGLNFSNKDIESVALNWKSFRDVQECMCSTPLDHHSQKHHCWKCGDIYCNRCIDRHAALPGLHSQQSVPLCRGCLKDLKGDKSP